MVIHCVLAVKEAHTNTEDQTFICEHQPCSALINSKFDSHSSWLVLQHVNTTEYTFFQCQQGQEFQFLNNQHWHCCHECMIQGMQKCVQEHYTEDLLHPPPERVAVLSKMILNRNIPCAVCATPLENGAFRFCLTQGLPFHREPTNSSNDYFRDWCCSLEHAKSHCITFLAALEEQILGEQ